MSPWSMVYCSFRFSCFSQDISAFVAESLPIQAFLTSCFISQRAQKTWSKNINFNNKRTLYIYRQLYIITESPSFAVMMTGGKRSNIYASWKNICRWLVTRTRKTCLRCFLFLKSLKANLNLCNLQCTFSLCHYMETL